jgi:hypothetical protein
MNANLLLVAKALVVLGVDGPDLVLVGDLGCDVRKQLLQLLTRLLDVRSCRLQLVGVRWSLLQPPVIEQQPVYEQVEHLRHSAQKSRVSNGRQ